MKNTELDIVFVEDVPAEAAMVEAALRRDGLVFSLQRVDTREEFLQKLEARPPDVILSDHGLPSFDGFTALDIAHKTFPQIPFIFVTNALNREMEIDKLAPGITDYIPKRQLNLLAPAIRRALQNPAPAPEPITATERERIIAKLHVLLAMYGDRGVLLPICAGCKKIRDKQDRWQIPEIFFKKHLGFNFSHGLCPDCSKSIYGD